MKLASETCYLTLQYQFRVIAKNSKGIAASSAPSDFVTTAGTKHTHKSYILLHSTTFYSPLQLTSTQNLFRVFTIDSKGVSMPSAVSNFVTTAST